MKIINETELMSNQKASTVIVPDVQFEAVQTASGSSLIFSLNESGILNCTCETPGDTHGWKKVDLSSAQAKADFPNQTVTVTHFDIGQDPVSRSVDLVMVLHTNGHDHLYVSLGNTNDNWVGYAPIWTFVKFDDSSFPTYATAPINNVYMARYSSNEFIFADLVTDVTTLALTRYAIDPTGQTWPTVIGGGNPQCWMPHNFPMTVQAGTLTSTIGCGPGDQGVNGIYTLGVNNSIANVPALVYSPLFNADDPTGPGYPTNFDLTKESVDVKHMAMAVSARSTGLTDLFFASNGTLYFVPNEQQLEVNGVLPTLKPIYTHDLFKNITTLNVNTWNDSNNDDPNGNIVLWGQSDSIDGSGTSQLFIMECALGHEMDGVASGVNGTAWSCPIPLLFNVVNSATYINNNYSALNSIDPTKGNAYGSCNVLFAQQVINEVSSLTQLFQDPVTTAWQQRSLLTAPTPDNIMTELYDTTTYSTHIEITDDNNITQSNIPLALWASSPCSVYINDASNTDAYIILDTEKPQLLTADVTGNVTIMQPVDTIGGISYYVAVQDPKSKQIFTEVVNPLSATSGTINTLKNKVPDASKDYLQGVQVTGEDGTQSPLVSSTFNSSTLTTSHNINTLCQQNTAVNTDGLITGQSWPDAATVAAAFSGTKSAVTAQPTAAVTDKPGAATPVNPNKPSGTQNKIKNFAKVDRQLKDLRFNPQTDKIWGWTYGKQAAHYEGLEEMSAIGVTMNADGSLSFKSANNLGSGLNIEAKLGHIVKWMQSEADKFEQLVVTFADGVIQCVVSIAGDFYHFLAKCANDLVNLVHTVLKAIETAFDDIIKWIGSIFSLGDIYRTHQVAKNLINLFINNCATDLTSIQGMIKSGFGDLETFIANYTDLPDSTESYSGNTANATVPKGSKSPSANWGSHKLKSNGSNANTDYDPQLPADPSNGLLAPLMALIQNEETDFTLAVQQLKVIAQAAPNTPVPILIKQVIGTIGEFVTETVENILLAIIGVMQEIYSHLTSMLDNPIDVPVISWLYAKITAFMNPDGKPDALTPLDAACLIAAIPATVIYKIVNGAAPFPENDPLTVGLTNVKDLATLKTILTSTTAVGDHDGGGSGQTTMSQPVVDKVGNVFAAFGSIMVSVCSGMKAFFPSDLPGLFNIQNKVLGVLNTVGYQFYVFPDAIDTALAWDFANQTWDTNINSVCTGMGVYKSICDAGSPWTEGDGATQWGYVSPWIDFVINLIWQIPTTYVFIKKLGDQKGITKQDVNLVAEFVGGTSFDLNGMCSPALAAAQRIPDEPDPTERTVSIGVVVAIMSLLNLVWGASGVLVSFDGFPVPE